MPILFLSIKLQPSDQTVLHLLPQSDFIGESSFLASSKFQAQKWPLMALRTVDCFGTPKTTKQDIYNTVINMPRAYTTASSQPLDPSSESIEFVEQWSANLSEKKALLVSLHYQEDIIKIPKTAVYFTLNDGQKIVQAQPWKISKHGTAAKQGNACRSRQTSMLQDMCISSH